MRRLKFERKLPSKELYCSTYLKFALSVSVTIETIVGNGRHQFANAHALMI